MTKRSNSAANAATKEPAPASTNPLKRLYTINEFADLHGMGRTTLYGLIKAGVIKTVPIGKGDQRIPHTESDRIVAEGARLPDQPAAEGKRGAKRARIKRPAIADAPAAA